MSGRFSFSVVFTRLSNQTTPLVSPRRHHSLRYSFRDRHNREEAAMPNAMCLSSVSNRSTDSDVVVLLLRFSVVEKWLPELVAVGAGSKRTVE